jgi:polar amino acid transport system substrate-binding protein
MRSLIPFLAILLGSTASHANSNACKPSVPESALIKRGTLTMAVNPTLPPMQFVDRSGELQGMRVELGREIAKRLCLKPEYVRAEFSAMIPGLQAGRWDVINSGMFYTEERAKILHMLPYEAQAISISTVRGNPAKIKTVEDLAGKSIGVEIGGFEERKARELDEQLRSRGRPGVKIRTFENFSMAFQALRAGQVDAALSIDATSLEYQRRGAFETVLRGLFPTPVALAARNEALNNAINEALESMKADGSFDQLLKQYGVQPL